MNFNYLNGGKLPANDSKKGFLHPVPEIVKKHSPKLNNYNSIKERLRNDDGPIGQAIRDEKWDLLQTALTNVLKLRNASYEL